MLVTYKKICSLDSDTAADTCTEVSSPRFISISRTGQRIVFQDFSVTEKVMLDMLLIQHYVNDHYQKLVMSIYMCR